MTRRQFIRRTVCSGAGIYVAGTLESPLLDTLSQAATKDKKRRRKTNVIFIITDDQKLDSFGFLNNKALTPNINHLANNEKLFI